MKPINSPLTPLKEKIDFLLSSIPEHLLPEQKYQKIMDLGKSLETIDETLKTEDNLVYGCQSAVYLTTEISDGLLYFKASSDALISSGLAWICTYYFSGLPPEEVIKAPADFVEILSLNKS